MTSSRKRMTTPLLTGLLTLLLTVTALGQTTITYYMATGQDDWVAWTRETAKAYEQLHPDIKIEVLSGNMENLLVMNASGIFPDVIHMDGGLLAEYAELGLLQPLDELVANDPTFSLDDYFPAVIESMVWKGELYALPRAWGAVALVYNKDLFDMSGVLYPTEAWTWDDLVEAGKKLTHDTDGDSFADTFGFMDSWANGNRFPLWIWQAGGDIWNEDFTEVKLADEASLLGLNFYYDLYFTYQIAPKTVAGRPYNEPGITTASQDDLFRMGKVAMVHATRYFTPDEVSWDIAPLAQGPAGRHSMLIPSVAGISPFSEHPDEAWEFLKFFASEEGFLAGENMNPMRTTYLGAIPPTIELAREKLGARQDVNELMWIYAGEQGRLNNLNNPFAGINGRSDLGALLNAVARQEQPLDTAIRELAARWQRAVDQTL